jgi:hypothetical protein
VLFLQWNRPINRGLGLRRMRRKRILKHIAGNIGLQERDTVMTDREMIIAGFAYAAGAQGYDLNMLREKLKRADADGAFDEDENPKVVS